MKASATEPEIERFEIKKGDVLITKDSESWDDIAVPAMVAEDLGGVLCGYHLAIIRSLPGKFHAGYLFRLFCSEMLNYQFKIEANGVTRFGLPTAAIDNALLLRPPLPEQELISEYIDRETARIDALIDKKRRLLELLEEKRLAVITHAVTKGLDPNAPMKDSGIDWLGQIPAHWGLKRLKFTGQLYDCKHVTPTYTNDGYPLVSTGEIKPFTISFSSARLVSEDDFVNMTEGGRLPVRGDIIYSRNASIGSAARVTDQPPFCMGQDICLVRPSDFRSDFLEFALNSKAVLGQIDSMTVGSTFRRINVDRIRNYWLPQPPHNEQKMIVEYLEQFGARLHRIVGAITSAIEHLTEYRSALITNAVTGKIDVRGEVAKEAAA